MTQLAHLVTFQGHISSGTDNLQWKTVSGWHCSVLAGSGKVPAGGPISVTYSCPAHVYVDRLGVGMGGVLSAGCLGRRRGNGDYGLNVPDGSITSNT